MTVKGDGMTIQSCLPGLDPGSKRWRSRHPEEDKVRRRDPAQDSHGGLDPLSMDPASLRGKTT